MLFCIHKKEMKKTCENHSAKTATLTSSEQIFSFAVRLHLVERTASLEPRDLILVERVIDRHIKVRSAHSTNDQ
jgi:hypothetical protein